MRSLNHAAALTWRAPPAASPIASPWGRRPAGLWALFVHGWRDSIDAYARAAGSRLPWTPFL
ncbi:MAG TPA: hypothetical protein VN814_22330 [Caulobacteraceae bacterium]|nr:hypothetical protein [Caulobacteraceae bacterium]